jgi:hypothetical protein
MTIAQTGHFNGRVRGTRLRSMIPRTIDLLIPADRLAVGQRGLGCR